MGRVILITSGKGGVGKTTITANLGIMLATCGKKVCLIDGDIGLNNLDVVLGVENKVVYDLIDVATKKCRPIQALIQDDFLSNLFVLPCSKSISNSCVTKEIFYNIVTGIKDMFDFVLIDCPAGIGSGFELSLCPAEEAFVVITPNISSVRDADKVVGILLSKKNINCSIIINRIRGDLVARKEMLSANDIERLVKERVIGIIPESDELSIYNSFLTKFASFKDRDVEVAFGILCKNIVNHKYDKFDYLSKYKGIIGLIRRNIKKRA
ncbi:MAG: septum site-determining protein MinD [Christensenellales bacterium]